MLYAKMVFISCVETEYINKQTGKPVKMIDLNCELNGGKLITVRVKGGESAVQGLRRFEEVTGVFDFNPEYGKLYFVGYERHEVNQND